MEMAVSGVLVLAWCSSSREREMRRCKERLRVGGKCRGSGQRAEREERECVSIKGEAGSHVLSTLNQLEHLGFFLLFLLFFFCF